MHAWSFVFQLSAVKDIDAARNCMNERLMERREKAKELERVRLIGLRKGGRAGNGCETGEKNSADEN